MGLNLSFAANPKGIIAGLDGILGFTGIVPQAAPWTVLPEGSLTLTLSGSLTGCPTGEEKTEGEPWPLPQGVYRFESAKAGGQLGWSGPMSPIGSSHSQLQIKAGLDYTAKANGSNAKTEDLLTENWDLSLSAALRGKRGRFTVKLLYPDFPHAAVSLLETWKLSLSWRIEWR
jgi:hypothetical protein